MYIMSAADAVNYKYNCGRKEVINLKSCLCIIVILITSFAVDAFGTISFSNSNKFIIKVFLRGELMKNRTNLMGFHTRLANLHVGGTCQCTHVRAYTYASNFSINFNYKLN